MFGGPLVGMASRSPEAAMTHTTLLPFQPDAMTPAQLAAVLYLARYAGHTHNLYAYQLRGAGSPGPKATTWTRSSGSSVPTSSSTSETSVRAACRSPRSTR